MFNELRTNKQTQVEIKTKEVEAESALTSKTKSNERVNVKFFMP